MTREEQLDWLCRLRSEIYVYMPKEWLIPMNDALDMAIKTLEKQPVTPAPKKCHNENIESLLNEPVRCKDCSKFDDCRISQGAEFWCKYAEETQCL